MAISLVWTKHRILERQWREWMVPHHPVAIAALPHVAPRPIASVVLSNNNNICGSNTPSRKRQNKAGYEEMLSSRTHISSAVRKQNHYIIVKRNTCVLRAFTPPYTTTHHHTPPHTNHKSLNEITHHTTNNQSHTQFILWEAPSLHKIKENLWQSYISTASSTQYTLDVDILVGTHT